ncbi:MAG: efflux RND transporter periplasmic adaptor subunit [Candidatus Sumerlaeota bacterium]
MRVLTGVLVFAGVLAIIGGAMFAIGMVYAPDDVEKLGNEVMAAEKSIRVMEQEIERLKRDVQSKREKINELSGENDAGAPTRRVSVEVATVESQLLVDSMVLPAEVEASEDIALAARSAGPIEWIGPKEGDRVEKGELIMRIDAEQQTQAVKSAEAAEKLARSNFERVKNLGKQGVSTEEALDQAESTLQQAEAALSIARQNLADAHLKSPISGFVDQLPFDLGEFVNRGQTVARIVDILEVTVIVNVPEKDVTYLDEGQSVKVRLPEKNAGAVEGKIERISLLADDMSRTYRVEATIPNREKRFRPGMITKMELVRRTSPDAIVIPMFAMLQTQDGPIVYVEENGVADMRMVKTGARRGMEVEILAGLEAGDRLIVAGQRTLTEGAAVEVVEDPLSNIDMAEEKQPTQPPAAKEIDDKEPQS